MAGDRDRAGRTPRGLDELAGLDRLRWLHLLTDAVSRANDLEEIYEIALLGLRHALGAERTSVLLIDPDGVMRFKAWAGISDAYRAQAEGHSPWPADAIDPAPLLIEDVHLEPSLEPLWPVLDAERIRAAGFVPLVYAGRLLGKFMLYHEAPHAFREDEVLLAQIIANHIAYAVQRQRTEARLLDARDELDTILRHVTDGITAQERNGHLLYVNDAAVRILGETSAEAVLAEPQRSLPERIEVLDEEGRPVERADLPASIALEQGREASVTVRFRSKVTGEERWSHVTSAPVKGADGSVRFAVNIIRDITEQRRAEQVLRDNEQALREAFAAAKRAEQRKDEFLAMLGHELRNPLSPIVTAVRLIELKGNKGQGIDRELTIINRQVRHVLRLVDDLLDVSRITRGKLTLKREPVELATVIANAVEVASPLLEARGQPLSVSVAANDTLLVDADPIRLAQVISNLLTNAARYSEPGSPVRLTAQRTDGNDIEIAVEDEGIGIDPQLLPQIFELFVQGGQNLDRSRGGLGLGLTIVRRLVELHDGRVAAYSEGVGKGSRFTVTLPPSAAQRRVYKTPPRLALSASGPANAAIDVLVVDDNADAADTLAEALAAVGWRARVAYDGPQALRIVETFRPRAAVLDIGLPLMDGYELAGRLRHALNDPNLRLIAVTGYGQEHDRSRARRAGFDAHFVKPVDPQTIITAIEAALQVQPV